GAIGRNTIDVDQRDFRHALLQHADARFDEPLALLGRLIFRVFAKIAQLARTLDLLRQLELQLVIQRRDFVFELPDQPFLHRFPTNGTTSAMLRKSAVPATSTRITSRHNPIVARYRAAARGDLDGRVLLDGAHLVADAIAAGMSIEHAAVDG